MKRLVLLLAVGLAACSLNTTDVSSTPSDPATETFASSLNVDLSQMTKTTNGVYYRDVKVGTGATLTGNPNIVFTFAGFLKDGSLFNAQDVQAPGVILSSLPFGVQEGLQGMKVGGERLLVIPSALGYGAASVGAVPPNSTLIIDLQLNDMQ